jgi:hypothetical protein
VQLLESQYFCPKYQLAVPEGNNLSTEKNLTDLAPIICPASSPAEQSPSSKLPQATPGRKPVILTQSLS